MTSSSRVIQMAGHVKQGINPAEADTDRSLPPILHSVRQAACKHLTSLLENLFNNIDDALFELVDRSHANSDQAMYFESMREIRLHRAEILQQFCKTLTARFDGLFSCAKHEKATPNASSEDSIDKMSLVKNDDLEVTVAVAGIVSKITSEYSLPIMQLTKRIDSICPNKTVTERNNPLAPNQLSSIFVEATKSLDIDIRVRIILLKLFERFVMENLTNCFEQTNRLLAEAGVLPDLKCTLKKLPDSHSGYNPAAHSRYHANRLLHSQWSSLGGSLLKEHGRDRTDSSPASGRLIDESFETLQELLSSGRPASPSARSSGGAVMSSSQLMTTLNDIQKVYSESNIDPSQPGTLVDYRQIVAAQTERITGKGETSLQRNDDDTVNLVGMLFDYILNDRNLAIPMKALISRLQIPILKIALVDKSFFNKSSHPARQLLNELSSAGIGWSSGTELKRDALYNKIESIILAVMNMQQDDLKLVGKLLSELRNFVTHSNRRSMLVEQRVRESEKGKAKTHAAKQTVQRLINQKASGLKLPPVVGRFISDIWSKVLIYICVSKGAECDDWASAIETLDQLLWSVQPLDDIAALEARERNIPGLLEQLSEGVSMIGFTNSQANAQISAIEQIFADVSDNDRAFLEDDDEHYVREDQPMMEKVRLTSVNDNLEEYSDVQPEPEFLQQISQLKEGTWVEMTQEDGTQQRYKVAAIVEPGNKYVFVNRRGMKVVEKTRMSLAVELKRKTIAVLEERQVFDRALQAVIGNLRQMQKVPLPS